MLLSASGNHSTITAESSVRHHVVSSGLELPPFIGKPGKFVGQSVYISGSDSQDFVSPGRSLWPGMSGGELLLFVAVQVPLRTRHRACLAVLSAQYHV